VDLLFNDLSIHGQFADLTLFRAAIGRLMAMREIAQRFGRSLYCHRNFSQAQVTPALTMPAAVQALLVDERRALMSWLSKQGPFWEDIRSHGPDDYLECRGILVTDSAVGEAAFCCFHGVERHIASLIPSAWEFSPVPVTWTSDQGAPKTCEVANHWDPGRLEDALRAAPAPLESWAHLERIAVPRCPELTFSRDSFEPLGGQPFHPGVAERILVLLETLNRLKSCRDAHGQRTPEGQRLYQNHFTGDKAWFTDSSDSDKGDFRTELTFLHPTTEGAYLFCPWHGKVKTPQFRVHFSWPVPADGALYVVYIGPKLTKR